MQAARHLDQPLRGGHVQQADGAGEARSALLHLKAAHLRQLDVGERLVARVLGREVEVGQENVVDEVEEGDAVAEAGEEHRQQAGQHHEQHEEDEEEGVAEQDGVEGEAEGGVEGVERAQQLGVLLHVQREDEEGEGVQAPADEDALLQVAQRHHRHERAVVQAVEQDQHHHCRDAQVREEVLSLLGRVHQHWKGCQARQRDHAARGAVGRVAARRQRL